MVCLVVLELAGYRSEMMLIVSKTAKRGVARLGFMFVLLAGFATWFAYDGWVTYPSRNLEAARQALPRVVEQMPPPSPAVTKKSAMAVEEDPAKQITLAKLQETWGEPAFLGPAPADLDAPGRTEAYFVGPYGWVRVLLVGQMVEDIEWHDGAKGYSDIAVQKLLAFLLGAVALVPLGLILIALPKKYQLDDEGLVLPGTGRIPYDSMTAVDAADFSKRGIVRLKYRDAGGRDLTAVLDEEKIAKFDEIVAALCKQKGWPVDVGPAEATDAPKEG
jgi:hypothetical protein